MSRVIVRIPMPLRSLTAGAEELAVEGATVGQALACLGAAHPGVLARILTPEGQIRSFVNIYLGQENVHALEGLDTALPEGGVLSIIPAVAGGSEPKAKERRLMDLRGRIKQITPAEALALQQRGAALIDVREQDEIAQGSPPGAHRLGRGFLELRIEEAAPDLEHTLLVMCNGGVRSLFAAEDLIRLGYRDVRSVSGGFTRWKNEGLPVEAPRSLGPRCPGTLFASCHDAGGGRSGSAQASKLQSAAHRGRWIGFARRAVFGRSRNRYARHRRSRCRRSQ